MESIATDKKHMRRSEQRPAYEPLTTAHEEMSILYFGIDERSIHNEKELAPARPAREEVGHARRSVASRDSSLPPQAMNSRDWQTCIEIGISQTFNCRSDWMLAEGLWELVPEIVCPSLIMESGTGSPDHGKCLPPAMGSEKRLPISHMHGI
jgi:hypothetical protein